MQASFEDVLQSGESGELEVGSWPVVRGALYFAGRVYECSLSEIDADPVTFDRKWQGVDPADPPAPFKTAMQFGFWTETVMNALEVFSGTLAPSTLENEAQKDSWARLRDMARSCGVTRIQLQPFAILMRLARDQGLATTDISRPWCCQVQDALNHHQRWQFRSSLRLLDRLHDEEPVAASGLLPDVVGSLPRALSPNERVPVPPKLQVAFEAWLGLVASGQPVGFRNRHLPARGDRSIRTSRFALGWFVRACVAHGAIGPGDDPPPEHFARQHLLDAVFHEVRVHVELGLSDRGQSTYWRILVDFLRRYDPRLEVPK